jgi:hypothetical protein
MADFLGFFNTSGSRTTVRFSFNTYAQTGASVAPSSGFEAADLRIYKDGGTAERTSTNGVTITSAFDSVTGMHMVSIDLTDNSDSGFYAAGSFYEVVLVPDETIDSFAVNRTLARFEIGLPQVNVTQFGGSAGTFSGGRPEVNATHFAGTAYATALAAEVDAIFAELVDGVAFSTVLARIYAATAGDAVVAGSGPYTIEYDGPGGTVLITSTANGGNRANVYA